MFVKVGETPNGKEVGYIPDGKLPLYKACFGNGGEIPKELGGYHTDLITLRARILSYIEKLENKPKKKKKAESNK